MCIFSNMRISKKNGIDDNIFEIGKKAYFPNLEVIDTFNRCTMAEKQIRQHIFFASCLLLECKSII